MRKIAIRAILVAALMVSFVVPFMVSSMALAADSAAQNSTRTLQGKVLSSSDKPLSGAIVYLEDSKTNSIRSFISTADGSYHFGQLATDTDYQIWARYKSIKSDTRGISSYDTRPTVVINFRIKTK